MREAYSLVWSTLVLLFRSRVSLEAEILILRHQLSIQRRHLPKRLAFSAMDRLVGCQIPLIAVGSVSSGSAKLAELGFIVLSDRPDKHAIGMNVNIIQHPRGWPKMISVRNNIRRKLGRSRW